MEIDRHRRGARPDDVRWEIGRYERRQLARQLAGLLDAMTGAA
jgi:hypothetical protein